MPRALLVQSVHPAHPSGKLGRLNCGYAYLWEIVGNYVEFMSFF